jgi:putative hydrolases of HD superfamily
LCGDIAHVINQMQLIKFFFALLALVAVEGSSRFIRGPFTVKSLDHLRSARNAVFEQNARAPKTGPAVPGLKMEAKYFLNFVTLVGSLKLEIRTGWHSCGIPIEKTESIADHMYRMAIMAWAIEDPEIDKFKAMKMALVHDMAEAITGDITPACGIDNSIKHELEVSAMKTIKEMLGDNPFGEEAESLWHEYAADETVEANFVKDIDKTELYIQAVQYENEHKINFQEWLSNARQKIRHPALQALADAAELERPIQFLQELEQEKLLLNHPQVIDVIVCENDEQLEK